jgi:hypothetical protein
LALINGLQENNTNVYLVNQQLAANVNAVVSQVSSGLVCQVSLLILRHLDFLAIQNINSHLTVVGRF